MMPPAALLLLLPVSLIIKLLLLLLLLPLAFPLLAKPVRLPVDDRSQRLTEATEGSGRLCSGSCCSSVVVDGPLESGPG